MLSRPPARRTSAAPRASSVAVTEKRPDVASTSTNVEPSNDDTRNEAAKAARAEQQRVEAVQAMRAAQMEVLRRF